MSFLHYLQDPSFVIELLQSLSLSAASIIGFIGVVIMAIGTVKGFLQFLIFSHRRYELITEIRIDIAKHLSLGLEFLVAKDIIKTIITPTFDELVTLSFLVLIRTALAYILAWEMRGAVRELRAEHALSTEQDQSKREKQQQHAHLKKI